MEEQCHLVANVCHCYSMAAYYFDTMNTKPLKSNFDNYHKFNMNEHINVAAVCGKTVGMFCFGCFVLFDLVYHSYLI